MTRAYGNNGMAHSRFVVCRLKNSSFPEVGAEKAGELWAGSLNEERK